MKSLMSILVGLCDEKLHLASIMCLVLAYHDDISFDVIRIQLNLYYLAVMLHRNYFKIGLQIVKKSI